MSVNFLESKPLNMDVVAPRNEQPVQFKEWDGKFSRKFGGEKTHLLPPLVDPTLAHPLFSLGGKGHFTSKSNVPCDPKLPFNPRDKWKPSLKIINAPPRYEKKLGVKHVDFRPGTIKGMA